jgi:hypothetical protein
MKSFDAWAILIALFLSGCATVSVPTGGHPIVGPDGSENEVVGCGAVDDCYNFSRKICGGTYKIVNSNTTSNSTGGKYPAVYSTFVLLVKCDSGHAAYPTPPVAPTAANPAAVPGAVVVDANAEFPKARSFKDCDQYESLYKDRCRDEVYARNKKAPN